MTATLCLLAFGAVMVYSASSATHAAHGQGYGSCYLIKFLVYGGVGLVADARARARRGRQSPRHHGAAAGRLASCWWSAVHIPHVGRRASTAPGAGSGRGQLQFQPSELLKLALVLYSATLLAPSARMRARPARADAPAARRRRRRPACWSFTQPDLGTAMVIAFTIGAMLVAAGIPLREAAVEIGRCGARAGAALRAGREPYARARLTSFLDPWAHASSSGFQAVQGQIAIGSGGLFGVGPGQSVQKIFYLPEAPTDFILAVDRRGARRRRRLRRCCSSTA